MANGSGSAGEKTGIEFLLKVAATVPGALTVMAYLMGEVCEISRRHCLRLGLLAGAPKEDILYWGGAVLLQIMLCAGMASVLGFLNVKPLRWIRAQILRKMNPARMFNAFVCGSLISELLVLYSLVTLVTSWAMPVVLSALTMLVLAAAWRYISTVRLRSQLQPGVEDYSSQRRRNVRVIMTVSVCWVQCFLLSMGYGINHL